MDDKDDFKKKFTRRSFILAGGKSILATAFLSRLYYLSILESSHYQTLSNGNRIRLEPILPSRGKIYDRTGYLLATLRSSYQLILNIETTEDPASSLQAIDHILKLAPEKIAHILGEIRRRPKLSFVPILDGLSWEEVCKLELNIPEIPGASIKEGLSRYYPEKERTPHFIGYVQTPSENDCAQNSLYRTPNLRIGKNGLERFFEADLAGTTGAREIEVNARGKMIRELKSYAARPGQDLILTIDHKIQHYTQDLLSRHESASAILMDAKTGHILTLASIPTFDPNFFTNGIRNTEWNKLIHNPYGVLNNKTVYGLYPPGSIFKLMFALGILESPHLPHHYETFCSGYIDVGQHRFHCWHKDGHGHVNLEKAIQHSCDIFFYGLARMIKPDPILEAAERFGFGQPTGIELPHEKSGLLPSQLWLNKRKKKWHQGDTILLSIGQGSLLVTPLQLCVMMGRLATNNKTLKPTLILPSPSVPLLPPSPAISSLHWQRLTKALYEVVNIPGGTAFKSRIMNKSFEMAGKTSTAQVRRITMLERRTHIPKQHEQPWKDRHHAMFAGYAPANDPQYIVSVVVEHGGNGGQVAAPLARDILTYAMEKRE